MMTTLDTPTAPSRTSPTSLTSRIVRVVKLHLANPWTPIYTPVMILTFIFIASYAVWSLVSDNVPDAQSANMNNGAVGFVLIYMLVIAVQTMNATFPFAMGFGVTRRDFYLGSASFFALLAAVYAAGLTVLAEIERATDGWGIHATFFSTDFLGVVDAGETFWQFFVLLMLFFFTGAASASVYVRWKANGLYVFFGSLAVLMIGFIWVVVHFGLGDVINDFFERNEYMGIVNWSLVVTGVMAVGGYLILRRATPRN